MHYITYMDSKLSLKGLEMVKTGIVARVNGFQYILETGERVESNLGAASVDVGGTIQYTEIRSQKTVRCGGRNTQWTEQRAIGAKFFKQVA